MRHLCLAGSAVPHELQHAYLDPDLCDDVSIAALNSIIHTTYTEHVKRVAQKRVAVQDVTLYVITFEETR